MGAADGMGGSGAMVLTRDTMTDEQVAPLGSCEGANAGVKIGG